MINDNFRSLPISFFVNSSFPVITFVLFCLILTTFMMSSLGKGKIFVNHYYHPSIYILGKSPKIPESENVLAEDWLRKQYDTEEERRKLRPRVTNWPLVTSIRPGEGAGPARGASETDPYTQVDLGLIFPSSRTSPTGVLGRLGFISVKSLIVSVNYTWVKTGLSSPLDKVLWTLWPPPLCGRVGTPPPNPPYRMWRILPRVDTEANDASNISEDMLMYDKKGKRRRKKRD